jgi:hypothetical protein
MLLIVATPVFTRQITALLSDEEYRRLQEALVSSPLAGALVPGGGGIRKMRMARPGHGKRGGVRVIYFWQESRNTLYMLLAYAKGAKADLSPREIGVLRGLVKALN